MISEFFLNIIFNLVNWILLPLPAIEWTASTSWVTFISDAMSLVAFLLPIDTITAIIALIIAFGIFRVFIAIVKSVWDLLPLV